MTWCNPPSATAGGCARSSNQSYRPNHSHTDKRNPTMLNRRSFLKAAGVCLPLPWLETLASAAEPQAGPSPGRAVFFMVPSGVNMWRWHPKEFGRNYQMSSTLEALAASQGNDDLQRAGARQGRRRWALRSGRMADGQREVQEQGRSGRTQYHLDRPAHRRGGRQADAHWQPGSQRPWWQRHHLVRRQGTPVNAENNLRRLFGELFGSPDVMQRLQRRASILDLVGEQARSVASAQQRRPPPLRRLPSKRPRRGGAAAGRPRILFVAAAADRGGRTDARR